MHSCFLNHWSSRWFTNIFTTTTNESVCYDNDPERAVVHSKQPRVRSDPDPVAIGPDQVLGQYTTQNVCQLTPKGKTDAESKFNPIPQQCPSQPDPEGIRVNYDPGVFRSF